MSASALVVYTAALVLGQRGETYYRAPHAAIQRGPDGPRGDVVRRMLVYHDIVVGTQYEPPADPRDRGKPGRDFSRLPTTYYHPDGPLGQAMQSLNWFPGPANTFAADARLPASLVALGGQPLAQLVTAWSEPPVAVLGLEVGTMAAYARPYQRMDVTERDPVLVRIGAIAEAVGVDFEYVHDARQRGAAVNIHPGEPRTTFAALAGERFYHRIVVETYKTNVASLHEDLLTREGMALLLSRLADGGMICFHTSNRYYDVVPLIAAAAADQGAYCRHGRDTTPGGPNVVGHFSSEWVTVARTKAVLDRLPEPAWVRNRVPPPAESFWAVPAADRVRPWTDRGGNSLRGRYRSDPLVAALFRPLRAAVPALYRTPLSRTTVRAVMLWVNRLESRTQETVVALRNGRR